MTDYFSNRTVKIVRIVIFIPPKLKPALAMLLKIVNSCQVFKTVVHNHPDANQLTFNILIGTHSVHPLKFWYESKVGEEDLILWY